MKTREKGDAKAARALTDDFMFEQRARIKRMLGRAANRAWSDEVGSRPIARTRRFTRAGAQTKIAAVFKMAVFDLFMRGSHEQNGYAADTGVSQNYPFVVMVTRKEQDLIILVSVTSLADVIDMGRKWRAAD